MKTYKTIDVYVQAAAIVVCIGVALANNPEIFTVYFVIGGLQLLDMLIHEVLLFSKGMRWERRLYHNISYFICACMIASLFVEFFLITFLVMLFAAPLMASWYLRLCYKEAFVYSKRPISILK